MHWLVLAAAFGVGGAVDPHEQHNELYRELVRIGLRLGDRHKVALPPARMPEGDAAAQQKALTTMLKDETTVEQFVRRSLTAPRLVRMRQLDVAGVAAPVYLVEVAFTAYGDLETLSDIRRFDSLATGISDRTHHVLTEDELAERKLKSVKSKHAQEMYVHEAGSYLNRLRVALTSRVTLSKRQRSLMVVRAAAPVFVGDAKYPCHWHILAKNGAAGPKTPYTALGAYAKITRLVEPEGALFLEFCLVYAEPREWFDDANFLRSRIPLLSHLGAMAMRAELLRARKRGQDP